MKYRLKETSRKCDYQTNHQGYVNQMQCICKYSRHRNGNLVTRTRAVIETYKSIQ